MTVRRLQRSANVLSSSVICNASATTTCMRLIRRGPRRTLALLKSRMLFRSPRLRTYATVCTSRGKIYSVSWCTCSGSEWNADSATYKRHSDTLIAVRTIRLSSTSLSTRATSWDSGFLSQRKRYYLRSSIVMAMVTLRTMTSCRWQAINVVNFSTLTKAAKKLWSKTTQRTRISPKTTHKFSTQSPMQKSKKAKA
jgi:hypothetical protein